jgi:hypothetical protein
VVNSQLASWSDWSGHVGCVGCVVCPRPPPSSPRPRRLRLLRLGNANKVGGQVPRFQPEFNPSQAPSNQSTIECHKCDRSGILQLLFSWTFRSYQEIALTTIHFRAIYSLKVKVGAIIYYSEWADKGWAERPCRPYLRYTIVQTHTQVNKLTLHKHS